MYWRFYINYFDHIFLQLKERISALEKQLGEEQQKTEDLQFSIDEATICGEDQVSDAFIGVALIFFCS